MSSVASQQHAEATAYVQSCSAKVKEYYDIIVSRETQLISTTEAYEHCQKTLVDLTNRLAESNRQKDCLVIELAEVKEELDKSLRDAACLVDENVKLKEKIKNKRITPTEGPHMSIFFFSGDFPGPLLCLMGL